MLTLKKLDKILLKICRIKSSYFIWYLKKKGCVVGENCKFYDPSSNFIDLTRPYLLELGDNVKISRGVILLTHGFEWVVLRELYRRPFGGCAPLTINDNVFVGMNSIILKGVTIGKNTIIGAGSVVTKNIPENVVAAGNPCVPIATIEEYYTKMLSREIVDAKCQARKIIENCKRNPIESDFYKSYFYLFIERNRDYYPNIIRNQVGNHWSSFLGSKPYYSSFDAFLSDLHGSQ